VRSLMTGSRGTALVNLMLNAMYMGYIDDSFENISGHKLLYFYEGAGDDVNMQLKHLFDEPLVNKFINLMGYAGQNVKLVSGRTELLRINYDIDGANGFLNRSISSAVGGEFSELESAESADTLASGIYAFVRKLLRRGMESGFSRHLLSAMLNRKTKEVFTTRSGTVRVTSYQPMMLIPVFLGGYGFEPLNLELIQSQWETNKLLDARSIPTRPALTIPSYFSAQAAGYASQAAINKLAKALPSDRLFPVRLKLVEKGLIGHLPSDVISAARTTHAQALADWLSSTKKAIYRLTVWPKHFDNSQV